MLNKKNIIRWGVILAFLFVVFAFNQTAQAESQEPDVNIYFFWLETCPYCKELKPVLESLAESDPRVEIYDFEVSESDENLRVFMDFAAAHGVEAQYVPMTFIGDSYWVSYSSQIVTEIEEVVQSCLETDCPDYGLEILGPEAFITAEGPQTATSSPEATPAETEEPGADQEPQTTPTEDPQNVITLPLIGAIDLSEHSLLINTLIISFIDGFNPCSLWVLSILLSITLQSRSRKKVLIVGSVFLFVTAASYALIIAGVFSVLRFISFIGWIQVVVSLIALGFALVNIKDYFWYKKGVSFTISDDKKPGIYKRMRGLLEKGDSTWRLVGATIVFAAGMSLIEFSCTAGFPVIWSNLLASQQVDTITFILLLLVYMIVYLLDEMGIFLVAVFTLRSSKLEEKHGRALKLVGGMLMLTLAIVMLIDPSIMNDLSGSLVIFGIALGLAGLILLVDRVILPKFKS